MAVKAKKAKEVKAHEVQAVVQVIPQATTVVREASGVDDVLALVESAKVEAAPAKVKKSGVPDVKVSGVEKRVLQYVVAAAQEASAKGRKEALGAELRPIFDDEWVKWCRGNKSFAPRIDINDQIAYTGGQFKVMEADEAHPVKAINEALR